MNLTKAIKERYGSLKHYAKVRKLNYNSLKATVSGIAAVKNVLEALKRDRFI